VNTFSNRWIWLLVCLPAVLAPACDWLPRAKPTPRPDVIVVAVDSLRRDHLDIYDYGRETAPNLRNFAGDSVLFRAAYSPSSWAKPAVASLLTGLYPWSHTADGESRLPPEPLRLAELLAAADYTTFAVSTHPETSTEQGFAQGFDEFVHAPNARADSVIDAALRRIEKTPAGAPLLLFLHLGDPRGPYDAPPPYGDAWPTKGTGPFDPAQIDADTSADAIADMRAAYDAEIAFVDAQFGRLVAALRAAGRYDPTMIVFTGTHGEELQEHGRGGHGHSLYEEVLAIPLLMKFPRQAGAGAIVHAAVSLVDVVPTILPIAGVVTTAILEGIDLTYSARDQGQKIEGRAIFSSLDRTDADGRRLQVKGIARRGYKAIRTELPSPATAKFFHLAVDPFEQNDLAEPERARLSRILLRLDASYENAMQRRRDMDAGERLGEAHGGEPYVPQDLAPSP